MTQFCHIAPLLRCYIIIVYVCTSSNNKCRCESSVSESLVAPSSPSSLAENSSSSFFQQVEINLTLQFPIVKDEPPIEKCSLERDPSYAPDNHSSGKVLGILIQTEKLRQMHYR